MIESSAAFRTPTARGNNAVRPQAATTSSRAWVSAKRARSDATTNVQLSAISSAPVTHAPLTAQTTGVAVARSVAPGLVAARTAVPAATSLKSTPALNTGSTAVTMIARVPSSASASSTSSQNRARMAAVSAFLTSGRLIVIVRTPSSSSTRRLSSAT